MDDLYESCLMVLTATDQAIHSTNPSTTSGSVQFTFRIVLGTSLQTLGVLCTLT